jgi:hypothetical protein
MEYTDAEIQYLETQQKQRDEYDALLKRNLIRLVNDHRGKCDENCNVMLSLVYEVAERAGLKFTNEERIALFV